MHRGGSFSDNSKIFLQKIYFKVRLYQARVNASIACSSYLFRGGFYVFPMHTKPLDIALGPVYMEVEDPR